MSILPVGVPNANQSMNRNWQGLLWRAFPVLVAFSLGFFALQMGVGFGQRSGIPDSSLWVKAYYLIGLFFLAGVDLGEPVGGSDFARGMMWVSYFLAPAVTATAVVEGLVRAINPSSLRLHSVRNHIVIGGGGRLAHTFLQRIREVDASVEVFVVENRTERSGLSDFWERYRAQVVIGDITSPALLRSIYPERARRVLLLTGDDLTNLEAAARIADFAPEAIGDTVAHVANLDLQHLLSENPVLSGLTLINTHQLSASHLVETRLLKHFQATRDLDAVVIVGFGRFGQTVLSTLQQRVSNSISDVFIVDANANGLAANFASHIGFNDEHRIHIIEGSMSDSRIWVQVASELDVPEPVFVLATSDDNINLQAALQISREFKDGKVISLSFRQSQFAQDLAEHSNFEVIHIIDLLKDTIHSDWL